MNTPTTQPSESSPSSETALSSSNFPSLAVNLAGLQLKNPTMTGSGTCGYANEYEDFVDISKLGAFVTKSITHEVRPGNPAHRIVETRAGMINAIGLANVGLDAFLHDKIPLLEKLGLPIIANVAGHSMDDYITTAGEISKKTIIDAIELNVSCPNVSDGLTFGTNPPLLRELVQNVKNAIAPRVKLIVKLSPNAPDVLATAVASIEGGSDMISLINTYNALAIDVFKRKPRIARGTGGLSGPAIRPLAVYWTHIVYRNAARDANVPIIGMGGIQTWQDAAEFILAGATGLGVGTALFVDPATPVHICDGLTRWLQTLGVNNINDVIGTLEMPGDTPTCPTT